MKSNLRFILSLSLLVLVCGYSFGQNLVEYSLTVTNVEHNFQCGTDGFFSNPEPRWKIRGYHVGGAVPGYSVINLGTDGCSASNPQSVLLADFFDATGGVVCASQFEIDYQSWEEDGCGSDNDFNGGGCANNDENEASATNTYMFSSYAENTPVTISINSSNGYDFDVRLIWNKIDAPTLLGSSVTTGCAGSNATLNVSAPETISGGDFYWYTTPTGGTSVATGSTYSPVISGSTTYYVAYGTGSCETDRTAVAITETSSSTAPTSLSSSPASLCGSGSVNLTVVGGSLGAGAQYELYDGSCGGTLVATSPTANFTGVSVSATTDFFVAISGTCNTTSCATVNVPVSTPSVAPTGATASATTVCTGDPVTLSVVGGSLGTSASWEWYSTSCGGVSVGSGASIMVNPSATTTYYVRAEGGCGNTICESVTVTVESTSTDPTSINASTSTICIGTGPVSLNVVGGSLGTGASWEWYETACGTGNIGSGTNIVVNPSVTTTYYVRAEGSCNNTNCASVTITVNDESTDPTAVVTPNTNLCNGQTAVLTVSGGSLGAGADWEWYEASCGGLSIGSGNAISVSPTATTSYFVRAEGTCNTTNCASTTITIGSGAADPDSATVDVNNICPEDTVTLTVWSSTLLPAGYTYVWYTGACGAVPVGVGQTLDVAPSSTITYYCKAVGTCGESLCASVTVNVLPGSVTPNGITTDNNNFCIGGTANLTVDGGSLEAGANWTWYENSCGGGTAIGTGSSITVTPTSSTTYYVRGEGGTCGNTQCATININVFGAQVYLVPFDTVCVEGNTAFNLTGGLPVGGTYSGTAVTGGVFNASTAGVGTHAITYTYTDGFGCSNTATENIEVVDANSAATSVTADNNTVCNSGSATLTVNGGNLVSGADWFWYENACGGGASIGNGASITVSPTQTTTYFVRAEGGNDYCGPTECVAITISVSNPEANLLPFDDVCGASVITLNGGIPGGGTYSGTGVSGGMFDAGAAGVGTHTITYTYTDGNGCSASTTGDITVQAGSITLETAIETQTCANGGVLVHAIASGGNGSYTYVWSDGTNENPHYWTEPGTYTVTVSDGSGCSASVDSIEVSEDLACLELANTFTPNGDGTNDTWNLDFTAFSSAELEVYSKWGVLVYQTDGLTINWDGNDLNGNALPAGTYYYIVNLDGGSKTQNGPITIVR
ncbi:gliding motility-associated C-terminal domain-containing protein [Parvicella tangerina]|uniref:Ig-like domain-containing protein n=1 Tax=Parvicella tangerina TaxID=2829795 RepID=A0A916JLF5_9FLAO|nr:gliding motility-associated C-terminal domain-containing protein [Parvicella tangerina]CAG5077690.1 hypothetical protein CRYO30217_00458 [Parvicella tangerina]